MISDWSKDTEANLLSLAAKHRFLLFEDRKLADIGNTVRLQARAVAGDWAELVTVHGVRTLLKIKTIKTVSGGRAGYSGRTCSRVGR